MTNKHKIIKEILELNMKPIIIKYKENLTEKESLELETKLIKTIGRLDFEQGPLTNLTDGEPGTNYSKYTRKKLSQIVKNYWDSEKGIEKKKRGTKRFKEWHKNHNIDGQNNPKFKYVYLIKNLVTEQQFEIFSLKSFCNENNLNYEQLRHLTRTKKEKGIHKNIWFIERKVYNETYSA